tara:strand:- start:933 stop:1805 length:873 start_codon:yes stop_codon:yes gene_type:complete
VFLKKVSKKIIVITGKSGTLGSFFYNKYKKKYKIISYPYRLEKIKKIDRWLKDKKFDYFIHFAAITSKINIDNNNINIVNKIAPIKIINSLNKNNIKNFKYFLFISSSHVYGFNKNLLSEKSKRNPFNLYGKTKKSVEDYIEQNKKKFKFKIGIARVFNYTYKTQKRGHFVPDLYNKIKFNSYLDNLNTFRDYIHINDIVQCLDLMIKKRFSNPLNICSGKKINLINLCKILNKMSFNKPIKLNISKKEFNKNIIGSNMLLRKLGYKKFKNINYILKSFLHGKKKNIDIR